VPSCRRAVEPAPPVPCLPRQNDVCVWTAQEGEVSAVRHLSDCRL